MKCSLLVCADSISIDQYRNTLCIFHIAEEYGIPAFPFVLPSVFVIALLERAQGDPDQPEGLEFIVHLSNQELLRNPIPLSFRGRPRMRAITQVGGLIISAPGLLAVTLMYGQEELAKWEIPVTNIGNPTTQTELPLEPAPQQQH